MKVVFTSLFLGRKITLNRPIFGKWEDNRVELTDSTVVEKLWFSLDMCYWITQKQVAVIVSFP
jgi:hypothetical protein